MYEDFENYYDEEHQKFSENWDKRLAKDLPDDYLASFIKHVSSGKPRKDLPNPLLCPHPKFMVEEAKARGWEYKQVSEEEIHIKFPDNVAILSPLPLTLPKKQRRSSPPK